MIHTDEELAQVRAECVSDLAKQIYSRQRAALLAGDVIAIRDLSNGLIDELADGGELVDLLRSGFTSSSDVTGRKFVAVMTAVARKQAEEEAEATIAAAERDAEPPDPLPRTRLQRIAAEWTASSA